MALTASATELCVIPVVHTTTESFLTFCAAYRVQEDIVSSLKLSPSHLSFIHPFNRENLFYEVIDGLLYAISYIADASLVGSIL